MAVTDFEKATFEGIREAISLVGQVIHLIPTVIQDCELAKQDLSKLIELAEIFEHPIKLVYRVADNLLVDGVEIYSNIAESIKNFK